MIESTWPSDVTPISGLADLPQVLAAERAIVFMSVEWSGPERQGRLHFSELMHKVQQSDLPSIAFFVVDEDNDALRSHFPNTVGCVCAPLGAGTMHWMEGGRIVAGEVSASGVTPEALWKKSASLWGVDAHSTLKT